VASNDPALESKIEPRKAVSNLVAAILCLASPTIQEDLKMMSELMGPLYAAHGTEVKKLTQGPNQVLVWYAELSTGCWLEDLSSVLRKLSNPVALSRMGITVEGSAPEDVLEKHLIERIDKLAFALVRFRARSCVWYSQGLPGLLAGLTCEKTQGRALSKIKLYYSLFKAASKSELPTVLKATIFVFIFTFCKFSIVAVTGLLAHLLLCLLPRSLLDPHFKPLFAGRLLRYWSRMAFPGFLLV
jgi:hypothetical protein